MGVDQVSDRSRGSLYGRAGGEVCAPVTLISAQQLYFHPPTVTTPARLTASATDSDILFFLILLRRENKDKLLEIHLSPHLSHSSLTSSAIYTLADVN